MKSINIILILSILISPFYTIGQSKSFLAKLDTNYTPDNQYIRDYNYETFFDSDLPYEEFDLFNPNIDLMNATIFFTINKLRDDKNRDYYNYSQNLEKVAYNYVTIKSRRRMENNKVNREKIQKDFPKIGHYFHFQGKLQDFSIATLDGIDYQKGKRFYFDRKDKVTDLKLYYGNKNKKSRNDVLIPFYTYESFAKVIVNKSEPFIGSNAKSKAYEFMGCYIKIDERTLQRNRIPQIKTMIVYGGFRLKELEEE